MSDAAERDQLKDRLREAFAKLTPAERQVLELRFGILDGRPRSLEETGKHLALTREQVRRVEATALKKLPTNALE